MKAKLKILVVLFSILGLGSCGDSHNPKEAGSGTIPNSESGMEGPDDLDRHGSETDTASIGGRTPAGSLTNQAAPSTNTRRSGNLTPDSKSDSLK